MRNNGETPQPAPYIAPTRKAAPLNEGAAEAIEESST
jgi:hypothetical protein